MTGRGALVAEITGDRGRGAELGRWGSGKGQGEKRGPSGCLRAPGVGGPALPTLRPARRPHPTHLLESPCLPWRPHYWVPLHVRVPLHLLEGSHRPSPPGAPSSRPSHPRPRSAKLPSPPGVPHSGPSPPGHQTAAPRHLGAPRPRTLGSRRAERALGPTGTSSWAWGGVSQPPPRAWGRGPGKVRKSEAPPIPPGFGPHRPRAPRNRGRPPLTTLWMGKLRLREGCAT